MAPKKRKSEVDALAEKVEPTVEVPPLRRVTRSLTLGGMKPLSPSHYSAVAAKRKGKKPKTTAEEEKSDESEEEEPVVDDADADADAEPDAEASGSAPTIVIIEHCKQCKSFSRRANEVREGLKNGLPDIKVVINPEKPRRGCFEIRPEDGNEKPFISLLNMKRPFTPMKDLNIEEVVADIIEKIQN